MVAAPLPESTGRRGGRPLHPLHGQVLLLWSQGRTTGEIVTATGLCAGSIASMIQRARRLGDPRARSRYVTTVLA